MSLRKIQDVCLTRNAQKWEFQVRFKVNRARSCGFKVIVRNRKWTSASSSALPLKQVADVAATTNGAVVGVSAATEAHASVACWRHDDDCVESTLDWERLQLTDVLCDCCKKKKFNLQLTGRINIRAIHKCGASINECLIFLIGAIQTGRHWFPKKKFNIVPPSSERDS